MSTSENKSLISNAFDHLSKGDGKPFVDLMSEDFTWIFRGSTNWRVRFTSVRDEFNRRCLQLVSQIIRCLMNSSRSACVTF